MQLAGDHGDLRTPSIRPKHYLVCMQGLQLRGAADRGAKVARVLYLDELKGHPLELRAVQAEPLDPARVLQPQALQLRHLEVELRHVDAVEGHGGEAREEGRDALGDAQLWRVVFILDLDRQIGEGRAVASPQGRQLVLRQAVSHIELLHILRIRLSCHVNEPRAPA